MAFRSRGWPVGAVREKNARNESARSSGNLEVTDSNPATRWETFGLNPQAWSSRISRIPPKDEFGTPVVKPKKRELRRGDLELG